MPDEIVLRSPTNAEFKRFFAPLNIAFNRRMSDAQIEYDRQTIELDRFVGALDGDEVVGCGGAYSFRLTVPGGEVGAAGITAVGVLPTHRRRGILRQMMRWWFDQARARHEPVAILWASEAAIYQRFGYGPGTQQSFLEVQKDKIRFLRPIEMPGRIRIVEPEEAARLIPSVYDAVRPQVPGAVDRSEIRWREELLADPEWSRNDNGEKVLAVIEQGGVPRGYAIYRQRSDWDVTGPKGVITVLEVTALDAPTEQALWQWLFEIDLIGTVRCLRGPVPHPLQLLVTEPRRLAVTVNDGTWLRIIDISAALEARTYGAGGTLVLDVRDEFCPWNAGRWALSTTVGGALAGARVIQADAGAQTDVALDIGDVAAVYLGAYRFSDLARAGRVEGCRPGAIEAADGLFATTTRPANATMF